MFKTKKSREILSWVLLYLFAVGVLMLPYYDFSKGNIWKALLFVHIGVAISVVVFVVVIFGGACLSDWINSGE